MPIVLSTVEINPADSGISIVAAEKSCNPKVYIFVAFVAAALVTCAAV